MVLPLSILFIIIFAINNFRVSRNRLISSTFLTYIAELNTGWMDGLAGGRGVHLLVAWICQQNRGIHVTTQVRVEAFLF